MFARQIRRKLTSIPLEAYSTLHQNTSGSRCKPKHANCKRRTLLSASLAMEECTVYGGEVPGVDFLSNEEYKPAHKFLENK
jgi:hypothetical protein